MKKKIAAVIVLSLFLILISACSRSGSTASTSNSGVTTASSNTSATSNNVDVRLEGSSFDQTTVTISKGGTVTLINDTGTMHIIQNGTWEGGVAKSGTETGAPVLNGVQFSSMSQRQVVGPFTTAGTFNIYCSVHPDMNLTIIVK